MQSLGAKLSLLGNYEIETLGNDANTSRSLPDTACIKHASTRGSSTLFSERPPAQALFSFSRATFI
jgi:hypothetical protein